MKKLAKNRTLLSKETVAQGLAILTIFLAGYAVGDIAATLVKAAF